jgi:hypothetical protein
MEKPTKRKAFNFLRSYFDVVNELQNDSDKCNFLMAIINKQFLDEDPSDLGFIVNLCYSSQKHSIEASVKGWKRVSNTDMVGNPTTNPISNPTTNPPTNPKEVEEEVEVKEKVKEKVKVIVKEKIINNAKFSNDCKTSEQWKETTAMQNKIKPDAINFFIDNFESHLITMEEQKKTLKEFKEHFSHWLRKQDLSVFKLKIIGKSNQL